MALPGVRIDSGPAPCTATSTRSASAARSSASTASPRWISGDTAGAAREVKEAGRPHVMAAISAAAGRRDLWPRRAPPPTSRTMTTTPPARGASPRPRRGAAGQRAGRDVVHLQRPQPARRAVQGLGGFATNGVNMTKLESYMVGGEFTATQFLADVEGHPEHPPVKNALEELTLLHHRREDPRRLPRGPVPEGDTAWTRPSPSKTEDAAPVRIGEGGHPAGAQKVVRRHDQLGAQGSRPAPRTRRRRPR